MHYYNIALIGSPLGEFTYHSEHEIEIGRRVSVHVKRRTLNGVVLQKCEKPEFPTNAILESSEYIFSQKQIALVRFISSYYICSLGDAFSVMTPFLGKVKTLLPKSNTNLPGTQVSTWAMRDETQKGKVKTLLPKSNTNLPETQVSTSAMHDETQKGKVEPLLPKSFDNAL